MIAANNLALESWLDVPENSDFPIQNIPFGIFKTENTPPRAATIIGETVIDLAKLQEFGYFDSLNLPENIFAQATLNDFLKLNKKTWRAVRNRISELFDEKNDELQENEAHQNSILYYNKSCQMLMPVKVGDYTDFYSSIEHATNLGTMFRGKENALMPNWLHLPVGYHGRASSIVISGTDIRRPKGQKMPAGSDMPVFGPSKLLDIELEMAFVTGQGKPLGQSISTTEAEDYIFGMVVFNDWSARDIQKWEYVPLGPFLGKSFASSISPWIVTIDALAPFRIPQQERRKPILPYLQIDGDKSIDIKLKVQLQTPNDAPATTISRSNYKYMYWSMEQQLAHHTVNGCNVNAGDMMASGTISGTTENSFGSMLEMTQAGKKTLTMKDGSERKFLKDGDTIIMKAHCEKDGFRIGFGEVKGTILPAL